MHFFACVSADKIVQRMLVGIVFALVDFACRHTVTKHLLDIAHRHFHRLIHFGCGIEVIPILKVVAISALVVHPRHGIAVELTLTLVGTARALIILRAREKLGGRIFGKIMKKPLPTNPCPKAMGNDAVAVLGDRAKMAKRVRHEFISFQILISYYSMIRFESQPRFSKEICKKSLQKAEKANLLQTDLKAYLDSDPTMGKELGTSTGTVKQTGVMVFIGAEVFWNDVETILK